VAGRRLATRDVGAMGVGEHVVVLGEGGDIPTGVYLVRLTRRGQSLTSRVVLIR